MTPSASCPQLIGTLAYDLALFVLYVRAQRDAGFVRIRDL